MLRPLSFPTAESQPSRRDKGPQPRISILGVSKPLKKRLPLFPVLGR